MLFHLNQPGAAAIENEIAAANSVQVVRTGLLTLADGVIGRKVPLGFAHDCLRTRVGTGETAFALACDAFRCWRQFDLGWARVANPQIPIAAHEIVAVEVHAFGLWSLNLSQIMETVHSATLFGFLYATTPNHAEEGEERFLLEFDRRDSTVSYLLEAASRPRHPLARLGFPATRALQHRFARQSHERMLHAVKKGTPG
jgi:uncharacterized protein (UPF0548 family)